MLKLIVCVDKSFGIAKNKKLPWSIPEEMQHFKTTTTNHTIVMGRKTFESIGKLLPNRKNIILSRNNDYEIEQAITNMKFNDIIELSKKEDVFIIGGSEIYKLFENYYDELIISYLNQDYNCDTFLKINLNNFEIIEEINYEKFKLVKYKARKNIIYGTITANNIKNEMINLHRELVAKYKSTPHLVIVQTGNNYASNVYIKNKMKLADELKINVSHIQLENPSENGIMKLIEKLNNDNNVHGILIQLPLNDGINEKKVINAISPFKDVDCFHPYNVGKMWIDCKEKDILIPCTPHGIIKMLEYYNVNLESKNAVIIGRSNIVSKPLASLLISKNCTVQICHSKTKNLKELTNQADIVISAIGKANFIDKSFVKDKAIIIDVGINRLDNGKICGDVNYLECIEKAQLITPVPFGVGPMTLIMLFYNLLLCYKLMHNENK